MATREIVLPPSTWTLLTIADGCFQCNCNMQVAESVSEPLDWTVPMKNVTKTQMYEYFRNEGEGLWGIASDGGTVTIDDEVIS